MGDDIDAVVGEIVVAGAVTPRTAGLPAGYRRRSDSGAGAET